MKPLEGRVKVAFVLLLTLLLLIGIASYKNLFQLIENNRLATKNRVILKKLEVVLTKITDAETGQRGYIITGDERYLEPYHAAIATIDQEIKELRKLIVDNPNQEQKLNALEPLIAEKLIGLNERINLWKKKGFEAAAQEVRSGKGRTVMDNIRKIISDMEDEERNLLELKTTETEASARRTVFVVIFGSSLAFLIVGIASFITRKELSAHEQAEKAIKESEQRFRTIFDNANDGILVADLETKQLYLANTTICQMLGYNADEILTMKIPELHQKKDLPYVIEIFDKFVREEISHAEEIPFKGKDGIIFCVDISLSKITIDGRNCIMGIFRDITERKQAEKALIENERSYRTLSENLPGIVYRVSLRENNRMQFYNDMVQPMTGFTIEELKAGEVCSIDPLILPEDYKHVITIVKQAIVEDQPFEVTYRLRHKDTSIRYFLQRGRPIYGEDGTPLYIDGLILDITDRKQAEGSLKKAYAEMEQKVEERTEELQQINESLQAEITDRKRMEDKLRTASSEWRITFDSTTDLIMLLDKEMNIIKANLATARFFNKSINEILGKNCFRIFCGTDKPYDVCPLEKVQKTKKHEESEVYLSERDIWLRISVDPILDYKGNLTGFVNIIRDVTERKKAEEALQESEERYRTVIEQSADCIYLADIETRRILEANQSFQHLLGYGPDEINRLTLYDFVIHEREDIDDKIEQILKGQRFFIGERRYLRKDGTLLDVEVSVSSISYRGKSTLCGVARNITDRKQAEEKLNIYQEQLRSLASKLSLIQEQERRRIAIDLHDHISQTLALCKIKLGTLQESASSNLTNPLEEIRNLIEKSIQYTRSLTFELSPPILYELGFEAAVESIGEQILRKHGILFRCKDDGQPKPMKEDIRIILFQVVRELLMNIAKHAHADKTSMSICKEGDSIRIHIEDEGVGFDTSKIDSFLSGNEGFGIFSIRERLNYIGGRIEIASKPGHGTKVTIIAPLKIEKKNI